MRPKSFTIAYWDKKPQKMNNETFIPPRNPLAIFFIFLVLLFSYFTIGQFASLSGRTILTLDVESEHQDIFQVFWKKKNQAYSEERSIRTALKLPNNQYRMALPPYAEYDTLRIDPLTRPGEMLVHSLILQAGKREILNISNTNTLRHYSAYVADITIGQSDDGVLLISSTGADPQLELKVKKLRSFLGGSLEISGISVFLSLLTTAFLYWLVSDSYRSKAHACYPATKFQWLGWGIGVFVSALYIMFTYPVQTSETSGYIKYPAFAIIMAAWFFILIFFLSTRPASVRQITAPGRFSWILYSLPALLVFSTYLLSFWPASLSPDSLDQWRQVLAFDFKDWHPAFHSLTLWLVTRVWEAPSMAGIFQIILLACSFGWALSRLQMLGVSRLILFVSSVSFAILPVNGLMAVTIWKDIPYSVSMMVLAVCLLEISLSSGKWLNSKRKILFLVLVLLFVSLFRHNGILPAFATPIVLLMLYPYQWKRIIVLFCILVVTNMTIRGPLYDKLDVSRGNPLDNVLTQVEKKIQRLFAIGNDKTPVPKKRGRNDQISREIQAPQSLPRRVQAGILERLQSASLLWRVRPLEGYYHRVDYVNVWGQKKKEELRIRYISGNKMGLREKPVTPKLTDKLFSLFEQSKYQSFLFWMWRPAVFLYILVAGTFVASLRYRKNLFLPLVPLLLNSAPTLLFVIHKSIFRYHYSIILTSLLLTLPFFVSHLQNGAKQNVYK